MEKVTPKSTMEWYDANAENYASNIENLVSVKLADKFVKLVGKRTKILDAGSAAGRDSNYFFNKGLEVTGVDLSGELIKIAKNKYPKIEFLKANFKKLPFENNTFDGIWCHASLVHMSKITDTEKSLKEFKRVLKNTGILYVYVKTNDKETDIVQDKLSGHKRFFRYYSKEQIGELVKKENFQIISSEYDKDIAKRADVKWIAVFARK